MLTGKKLKGPILTLLLDTSEDLEEEARRQFEAENTQEKIRGDF